jgi:hypothetical protein
MRGGASGGDAYEEIRKSLKLKRWIMVHRVRPGECGALVRRVKRLPRKMRRGYHCSVLTKPPLERLSVSLPCVSYMRVNRAIDWRGIQRLHRDLCYHWRHTQTDPTPDSFSMAHRAFTSAHRSIIPSPLTCGTLGYRGVYNPSAARLLSFPLP